MRKTREKWDTNRDAKRAARCAQFWCDVCDACIVGAGQKCPNCRHKQGKKKWKKPYPQ